MVSPAGPALSKYLIHTRYGSIGGYEACEINGSQFVLLNKNIPDLSEDVSLDFSNRNLVILHPIEAEKNVTIKAITIIVLNNILSKTGVFRICSGGKFVLLGSDVKSQGDNCISTQSDIHASPILKDRKDHIMKLFNQGITQRQGQFIFKGLLEVFDAINDPNCETNTCDIKEALQYFNLRVEVESAEHESVASSSKAKELN